MGVFQIGKTWYVDYYVGKGTNRKRVREAVSPKKADAIAYYGKIQGAKRENRLFDMKRECTHTFDQLLERYAETIKVQKCYKDRKYHLPVLKSYFSGRLLTDITPYDLEQFRNKRKATPIKTRKKTRERSVANVNRILSTLRHAFSKAVEWNLIEKSPFSKCKRLFYREENERLRYLTDVEENRLLRNCTGHIKPIVITALNTGMRLQEILSLQWKNVHLESSIEPYIEIEETKNNQKRFIPLNDDLGTLFESIRNNHPEYVFIGTRGRPLLSVKNPFATALQKTGITDFKFHDLRHTFASHFVMNGGDLLALKDILGHSSLKMVMRYAHLASAHKRKLMNNLNGKFSDCHPVATSKVKTKKAL